MDSFRHQGLRKRLIEDLRQDSRFDEQVLQVMGQIPRHRFLDSTFAEWAYQNRPFPIACEQTISQPSTVAWQSSLLGVLPRQMILEIGTGSGYQAAVLSLLGGRVFTLERHPTLFKKTKLRLQKLKLGRIRCFLRDGYGGLPEMAPFQRIIVTCGAPKVPQSLLLQLVVGGRAVIPVGPEGEQRMLTIDRLDEEEFRTEDHGPCAFVPFTEGLGH